MQGRYRHTIWISAASEETILTSFVELARLFIPKLVEQEETNQRSLVAILLRWLEQCMQPWLLIFDNADDLSLIQPYLPRWGNGCILITTRASAVGAFASSLEVDSRNIEDAVQLDGALSKSVDLLRMVTPDSSSDVSIKSGATAASMWRDVLPVCPQCQQTTEILRSGKNRSGSQRFRCRTCQLYFTPQPGSRKPDQARKAQTQALAEQGMSYRRIARQLNVHHRTVSAWINTHDA